MASFIGNNTMESLADSKLAKDRGWNGALSIGAKDIQFTT